MEEKEKIDSATIEKVTKINNILESEKYQAQNAFHVGLLCSNIEHNLMYLESGHATEEQTESMKSEISKIKNSLPASAWECVKLYTGEKIQKYI